MSMTPPFADLGLARRLERTDAWVGLESARIFCAMYPESGAAAVAAYTRFTMIREIEKR